MKINISKNVRELVKIDFESKRVVDAFVDEVLISFNNKGPQKIEEIKPGKNCYTYQFNHEVSAHDSTTGYTELIPVTIITSEEMEIDGDDVSVESQSIESMNIGLDDNERVCESCSRVYDVQEEPSEVKESGQHICSECWNEEE